MRPSAPSQGPSVFKIIKMSDWKPHHAAPQCVSPDAEMLTHHCCFEAWSADLSTSAFALGPQSRFLHGMPAAGDCGLSQLIRCYEPNDRRHVLALLEGAATDASSFCYSTTAVHDDGTARPLMCIGQSTHASDRDGGILTGLFIFPRFQLPQAAFKTRVN